MLHCVHIFDRNNFLYIAAPRSAYFFSVNVSVIQGVSFITDQERSAIKKFRYAVYMSLCFLRNISVPKLDVFGDFLTVSILYK